LWRWRQIYETAWGVGPEERMKELQVIERGSFDEVVAELKRLRHEAEASAALFLTALYTMETVRDDIWRQAGVESFDMFLNTHHLCNAARYREFCAGLRKLGGDTATAVKLGEGATAAARFFQEPTPEKIAELSKRTEAFEEINQVLPSQQHAQTWVKQLEPHEPKVVRQTTELARLRAEVQQLRAQLRQAEQTIRQKDKELDRLKAVTTKRKGKAKSRPTASA